MIKELTAEVNQLRSSAGNISHAHDQFHYLQQRYQQLEQDKNRSDHACSEKLCEGMKVVQKLVGELDEIRGQNM